MHTRTLRMTGVILSALVAAACGDGPDLVDRTQPNYFRKSDLTDGTWYIQNTVVGVPPTSAIAFEGLQDRVEKVRFEVQEDYLVAYRSYEYFPGSEASVDRERSTIGNVVTVDGKPYRGAPVAAWRIESHFDRIREYNPATGEQSNVLVENITDRPWYERDYIRVNWGSNAITNWNSLSSELQAPLSSYVQPIDQEKGDDGLVTEYAEVDGRRQLQYMDFTVRQYWEPESVYYPGYGNIPYCWLNPVVDCRGSVIKVRTSIRRVDPAAVADYEPLPYDDRLMKKFGFFRLGNMFGKPTYDRYRGSTLSGRLLFAQRHNIWKRSKKDDGSPIPVAERQPKPIVYYLSDNFPKELMESARGMEASWDRAFRKAVAVPRGIQVSDVPQMFYVCENPVPAGAPAACGPEGRHVRMGDIRYHMVNWVDHPQLAGPLGYGPSGVDPETGEIIHAVANIYGAGIDNIAGNTLQLLDVMTGDISLEDLIAGKDVQDFLRGNRNPTDPRRQDGPATSKSGLTNDETQKFSSFGRITGNLWAKIQAAKAARSLPIATMDTRAAGNELIRQNPMLEAEIANLPEVRAAVLASAPGETWRQKLLTDESFYRQVARETMLRLSDLEDLLRQREEIASRNSIWLAEFNDGAYIWLARDIKNTYEQNLTKYQAEGLPLSEAKVAAKTDAWNQVRNALNRFITEHEVGHTLGLMHNFVGSFDAMNYKDGYWELRKETIGVMAGGQRVLPVTPQDLKDAAVPTEEQLAKGMPSLQYSTVMDYTARFPNHPHGIGKYDEAAILFGYSGGGEPGWVEVFNETRVTTEGAYAWNEPNIKVPTTNMSKPLTIRGAHTEIPLAHVTHWHPGYPFYSDKFHYTTLPFHFADRGLSFEEALEQGIRRMQNRSYRRWAELQGLYEAIEVSYNDYANTGGSLSQYAETGTFGGGFDVARDVVRPIAQARVEMPIEVPYMYCSDYEVGGNLACNRYDSGADFYEMARDWIDRYNDYYVFSNFRRDRAFFSPVGVVNAKLNRYTMNLTNMYQHWIFNVWLYQAFYGYNTEQMDEYLGVGDPIHQNYWTMGVIDGVNHVLNELATPAAGYFGKDAVTGRWVHLKENNVENTRFNSSDEDALRQALTMGPNAPYTDIVYVPRGTARNQYTLFDTEGFDFYTRVNEVGHFWDQLGALFALTENQTVFIGVDRGADQLRYSIPYYYVFYKELGRMFSNVFTENTAAYASHLVKVGNGLAEIRQPVFVRAEDYVSNFRYPTEITDLPPVDGNPVVLEPVEPSTTWSTRLFTQIFGMRDFLTNWDYDYHRANQVFRLGSGESVTPGEGFELVTFTDPFDGGYMYAAVKKVGDTDPYGAAFQVQRAAQLKADWDYKLQMSQDPNLSPAERAFYAQQAAEYEGKVRDAVRNLEIQRALFNIFDGN